MTIVQTDEPTPQKPLRLWPGVVAVVLQWLIRFVVPIVVPGAVVFAVLGGLFGGLAIAVWWVFLSRAPWSERLGAIIVMIAALFATSRILHESIARGAQGMLFVVLAIPVLSLAFVAWAVASRRLSDGPRRAAMVATILLASGGWALVRTGGMTGNFDNDLMWRWAKTPEERLLAQAADEQAARPAAPAVLPATPAVLPATPAVLPATPAVLPVAPAAADTGADWPGFRGPHRDGIIPGVRIETDWSASPPVALWRRPIGPGWSSFAVHGDLLYTQEQRGGDEVVACYNVTTGKPVWKHRDAARFWESNGGAGPRATPTLSNGRVYTFGATGILNVLDARDGAVVWSRNAASDTGTKVPGWGFASSPLVVDDVVIVAAEGRLAAYDLATGNPRWVGPAGGAGYSSPHLLTIDGVAQVLLASGASAISFAPADGTRLWEYSLPPSVPIVQPALTADGDILISTGGANGGNGICRIAVAHGSGGWTVEERWTSIGLKPYFNDFVVHKGHAFGFDGSILACIDLKDGTRKWKGGRYGNGQLVLLPDQDLLLVLSEEGELALVAAAPDRFTELAQFPAIEGKTWNHPVLVGDVLLVRNGQEMAAFRLSLARR
ncbi:MAG: PQQ-like beta-propeller repeat protein [Acidobacteriia bacterium]|nr:PQQ-like beta-propeller repeat protein [Terriglobia bacterium]